MLRALWLILRLALLVAGVIKIADIPGNVQIDWQDYTFTINLGFFILMAIAFVLLTIFIFQVIKTFVDFPKSLRRYNEVRRFEKGYKALTQGLTAVAAGDTKAALSQSKRVRKFMPEDKGLPLLLEAQAARMDGREDDAAQSFTTLLEDKDASFLGVRGLLQAALDKGDHEGALALAEKALAAHPKQPWILKIVYEQQVEARTWMKALETLSRAEKVKALSREQMASDRRALLIAQGDDFAQAGLVNDAGDYYAKAIKIDPSFAPAVCRAASLYREAGHLRKARSLIEKAWKAQPHPDLFKVWADLIEPKKQEDPMAQLRWAERLMAVNPSSASGWLGSARAAMAAGLWGEAKSFIQKAGEIEESAAYFKLLSELEDRTGGERAQVRELLLKAAGAKPAKAWICSVSGKVYPEWRAVAEPHGGFNTIIWDVPGSVSVVGMIPRASANVGAALLDVPR